MTRNKVTQTTHFLLYIIIYFKAKCSPNSDTDVTDLNLGDIRNSRSARIRKMT